jgi:hypothetical protein
VGIVCDPRTVKVPRRQSAPTPIRGQTRSSLKLVRKRMFPPEKWWQDDTRLHRHKTTESKSAAYGEGRAGVFALILVIAFHLGKAAQYFCRKRFFRKFLRKRSEVSLSRGFFRANTQAKQISENIQCNSRPTRRSLRSINFSIALHYIFAEGINFPSHVAAHEPSRLCCTHSEARIHLPITWSFL